MATLEDLPYRPCAGVVLTRGDGRVFAGERIDTPGAWQMPQGGIDEGESPMEAGRRELWEETGVAGDLATFLAESADWLTYDLPPELAGSLWGGRFRGQKQKWLCFRFEGRDADVDIAAVHPEFSAWRWVAPPELKTLIVPFKRDIYDRVLAEFSPQIGG